MSSVITEGHLADSSSGGVVDGIITKVMGVVDVVFPPAQRSKWWEKFKAFAVSNPKITAFLLTNVVLSGGPLLLFVIFTITVFVVSLVAALIIGLIAALLFTVFMLLIALFIVLPTVFLTTMGATFLFLWGLGGYYIIKWFNEGETPAEVGQAIGDRVNSLTGGRLGWLVGSARTAEKGDDHLREKEALLNRKGNGLSAESFSSRTRSVSPAPVKAAVAGAGAGAGGVGLPTGAVLEKRV